MEFNRSRRLVLQWLLSLSGPLALFNVWPLLAFTLLAIVTMMWVTIALDYKEAVHKWRTVAYSWEREYHEMVEHNNALAAVIELRERAN